METIKQSLPESEKRLIDQRLAEMITPERVDGFIQQKFPERYEEMKKAQALYELVDEKIPSSSSELSSSSEVSSSENSKRNEKPLNFRSSFRDILTKEEKIELSLENLQRIFKRTAEHSPKNSRVVKVSILGNPNAGKSTILNQLVRRKVSAVSPKTQTTRKRSLAVLSQGENQAVFFDTPGLLNMEHSTLKVDKTARETIEGLHDEALVTLGMSDVVLLLIDVTKPLKELDHILDMISRVKNEKQFHMCALINKCDMVEMDRAEEFRFELVRSGVFNQAFIVSAKTGYGIESVKNYIFDKTYERKWFFNEDQVTPGMTTSDVIKEVVREKLYRRCNKEVPYQCLLNITKLELAPKGEDLIVDMDIIVRTEGQKKIVSHSLKYVNIYATDDLQRMYKYNVHLMFNVRVASAGK